ncbi:MAG TPA: hypothetical protein VIB38_11605 [Aestuariivirgaceae bacterium]|jgi:hypothetical protein
MIGIVKPLAIASAAALMAIGTTGTASAQSSDVDVNVQVQHAKSDWKFDARKHRRQRHKDNDFRFFFGGFWYPQPYWLGYGLNVPYRIGCGEGRAIVRDRGFNRVRTIECQGRSYTYLGRRHGDRFRVMVNSRNGRIIDVDRI